MAWGYLLLAGVLEIVWAFTMKQSDGFTRLIPTAITLVAMIGSFALLSISMRTLPLGTAYTVWTGIGAVGAFLVGVAVLGEAVNPMRVAAAVLIVSGLLLMKFSPAADGKVPRPAALPVAAVGSGDAAGARVPEFKLRC